MIAQDLRREVHRMLLDGHTDDEILAFMYERYGDFILYRPRLGAGTLVLWFGPLLLLVVAGFVWFRLARAKPEVLEINTEEQARLDELLRDSDP
jgi:cytochrome c-type biogenesis protein CcmH